MLGTLPTNQLSMAAFTIQSYILTDQKSCLLVIIITFFSAYSLQCISNINGGSYDGHINITTSGRQCQRWDAQSPHSHNVSADLLPDLTLGDAANYCRSPTFDTNGPWCYTVDPGVQLEYCDIPKCSTGK